MTKKKSSLELRSLRFLRLKTVIVFTVLMSFCINSKALAAKKIPLNEIDLEIVVSPQLNLDIVCQGLGPQFTSSGPWGFKLTSKLECSTSEEILKIDLKRKYNAWKVFVDHKNQQLIINICRKTKEKGNPEAKCEANVTVPSIDLNQALSIFTSEPLMTVIAASLYDQLPVKSQRYKTKIGLQKINLKKNPSLKNFPKTYSQLIEAKVYLTTDGATFNVEQVEKNSKAKNKWIISLEERGEKKQLFDQIIKKILSEQPPRLIEPPIGKFSAYSSLFPPTGAASKILPPALFEVRVKAGFDKPLLGFKPNFEFGLRKMITYVQSELITTSTEGTVDPNQESINIVYEDSYYYYIGTNFKFLIEEFEFEPSIAFGVNHSKLKTRFGAQGISTNTSTFNASATKIGLGGRRKLFTLPLIGQITAEGALRTGLSKSPSYSQKWVSASGGASLLVPIWLIPTWSHLAKVTLEGYGEITAVKTDWSWNQVDLPGNSTVSSVPVVGVFGISSYWY